MSGHDIPERGLMAEVIALRAELDAARAGLEESQREWSDAKKEVEELSRDLAARMEQVDPDKDVWQYLDGLSTETDDAARAERTEPATGEDVDALAREVAKDRADRWGYVLTLDDLGEWLDHQVKDANLRRDIAVLLAALDLPGREQALARLLEEARAESERLKTVIRIHVGGSMAYHVNECADCEPELSSARQHATAEGGAVSSDG